MKDVVSVEDRLRVLIRDGASNDVIKDFLKDSYSNKDPISIVGHLSLRCRERGKIVPGSRREGHNIWTLAGGEYLSQLMSYKSYGPPAVPQRNDRMRLIGFGVGSQPEVRSVNQLIEPIPYNASNTFLAQLAIPTYPLAPSRTTVRYSRTFGESELSVTGTVTITEAGLFTDGNPDNDYEPGTRDDGLSDALNQVPAAYKVFEPLPKSQEFTLEVSWEIRF